MMTSEEYERAKKYLNDFYERGKDTLQFMIDAAQEADGNMTKILGVPPPEKTFTEGLVTSLFAFALGVAFPGWTVVSKVFKGIHEKADHARVLALMVESGLHLLESGGGAGDAGLAQAKGRIAAINNMIAGLAGAKSAAQRQREEAEGKLLDKAYKDKTRYTFAQIRAEIGELPPLMDQEAFLRLIYCFEYQLWQTYVTAYVTLKLTINFERRIVFWDTAGINKNAVVHLTTAFTKFVPTGGPSIVRWEALRAGSFSVRLPGLHPIRSYTDLATVWYADAIIEGAILISGGEKISSALEEEIKMTSVKTHGVPLNAEEIYARDNPEWPHP